MRKRGAIWHDRNRGDGSSEVCLVGADNAERALRMWQGSRGHNAMLLSPGMTIVGIGQDGKYWTMRGLSRSRSVERERTVTQTPILDENGQTIGTQRTVERSVERERTVTREEVPGSRVPRLASGTGER